MLNRLRRWLGWDGNSGPIDFGDFDVSARQRPPPTANPPAAAKVPATYAARNPGAKPPAAKAKPTKPVAPRPSKERDLLEILDNPKLTLDRPISADDGFDPYNTGAFNRSASWERISRKKR